MPPLLSLRALLVCSCLLVDACSTPISPYSPLADEDEAQDELPVVDAGAARDSGARDAGRPLDAGSRDAGTSTPSCGRIPNAAYYATLIDDDCASRAPRPCMIPGQTPQLFVNQLLAEAAGRCGLPKNVALGVRFSPSGCPRDFGADGVDLRGRLTQCLQNDFEMWRLSCSLGCAVMGDFAR